jgi:hypothetical protein
MSEEFKLLGHGFDTIQVSFQTRTPDALAAAIGEAQQTARETRQPQPVVLGPGKVRGEVLRHGGGGGDAIFSTGELGEMYFFKLAQKGDEWGVTVKIRALALLCYGLPVALERMWARAKGLGLQVRGYSLGRIDYRFDVQTDVEFALEEKCLIRPNRTLVRPFEAISRNHPIWDWSDNPDVRRLLRGTRIETLMVGKIGNGIQVVIYDKRAELIATRNSALLESYGLASTDPNWRLWRVEIRFAGDVLKRRWNVRDLPALRQNLHPMLDRALKRVRYVNPGQDHIPEPRRSIHEFWRMVTAAVPLATCEQPSQFASQRAEFLIEEERRRSLKANIEGCSLGLAAMQTTSPSRVAELAPQLAREVVENALIIDPGKAQRAVDRVWQYNYPT